MMEPFALSLLFVLFSSIVMRSTSMMVAIGVLIGGWVACVALTEAIGSPVDWFGLFCIDFTAAMLLLVFYHKRWQLYVVAFFIAMLAAHFTKAFMDSYSDHSYMITLNILAWAQLAVVAGRGVGVVLENLCAHNHGSRWLCRHIPVLARMVRAESENWR